MGKRSHIRQLTRVLAKQRRKAKCKEAKRRSELAKARLLAIGEDKLSNGSRLTHIDWRANRLVDKLAKIAAGALAEPKAVVDLVDSLDAAAAHAAALLGIVTHSANNHRTCEVDHTGKVVYQIRRDSVDKPKSKREPIATSRPPPPPPMPKKILPPKQAAPWKPPRPEAAGARNRREQMEATARCVQDIGSTMRPSASEGASALATVHARILARIANTSELMDS